MPVPSAGDVERFVYCPQNYWLAKQGVTGDGDDRGRHEEVGDAQARVESQKRDYRDALRWSFRILLLAASVTLLSLEVLWNPQDRGIIVLTTALVLVASSSGLLAIALDAQRRYKRGQVDAGLVPGKLAETDLRGTSRLLQVGDLRGRPDSILETAHGLVPVEVKSTRTPEHPYDSHRMQVATYLKLLSHEGPVEYGLLNYPEGVFRIGWDAQTQAELDDVLQRIASGERARNHHHVARCRGCARRDACPQRLEGSE